MCTLRVHYVRTPPERSVGGIVGQRGFGRAVGTLDRRYQMFAPLPTLVPNKLPDQTLKIHFTPAGRLHESHPPWTMPFTVDGFTHFDHALFPIASRHRSQFKVDAREDGDDGRGSATNATEPGHREAAAAAALVARRSALGRGLPRLGAETVRS